MHQGTASKRKQPSPVAMAALHGLDILAFLVIVHRPCHLPRAMLQKMLCFFFAKSQIVVLVEGFGGEIDRESRKLRVKPGNLALVLSTWCCFSSLSPFGRIIMVMPGWGFDNFIRQERL